MEYAMIVDTITMGPVRTNCYLVTCEDTGEALLIDPGDNDPAIASTIARRKAIVRLIVNTHTHFDHIGGNAVASLMTGAPIAIHEDALPMLRDLGLARSWNLRIEKSPEPGQYLEAGDYIPVGNLNFKVLLVPGHAPGHIALFCEQEKVVFVGDVLFNRGVGRTDLPYANGIQLIESIRNELFTLPDDTLVYPGHGPHTTIGAEKAHNPIIRITSGG